MTNEMTSPLMQYHGARKSSTSCAALTLYLDNLAPTGRRSMRSLLQNVATLQGWSGALEQLPWLSLHYEHVAGIRATLRKTGKSPNTINTTLAAMRGVLKAGFLSGQYPAQEWQRIQSIHRAPGKQVSAGRCLQGKEIDRLLQVCRQDGSLQGLRDAAIVALLAYAGLRRSEVTSLNITDYRVRNGHLRVREGKGNRSRELLLPVLARAYIRRWIHCRGNSPGPLFCQLAKDGECDPLQRMNAQRIYGILKRRAREAGIASCTPHDLRRTFVTRLLEQGVDFNTTRQLAGHENIQTTILYDRRHTKAQRQAMANFSF